MPCVRGEEWHTWTNSNSSRPADCRLSFVLRRLSLYGLARPQSRLCTARGVNENEIPRFGQLHRHHGLICDHFQGPEMQQNGTEGWGVSAGPYWMLDMRTNDRLEGICEGVGTLDAASLGQCPWFLISQLNARWAAFGNIYSPPLSKEEEKEKEEAIEEDTQTARYQRKNPLLLRPFRPVVIYLSNITCSAWWRLARKPWVYRHWRICNMSCS